MTMIDDIWQGDTWGDGFKAQEGDISLLSSGVDTAVASSSLRVLVTMFVWSPPSSSLLSTSSQAWNRVWWDNSQGECWAGSSSAVVWPGVTHLIMIVSTGVSRDRVWILDYQSLAINQRVIRVQSHAVLVMKYSWGALYRSYFRDHQSSGHTLLSRVS